MRPKLENGDQLEEGFKDAEHVGNISVDKAGLNGIPWNKGIIEKLGESVFSFAHLMIVKWQSGTLTIFDIHEVEHQTFILCLDTCIKGLIIAMTKNARCTQSFHMKPLAIF